MIIVPRVGMVLQRTPERKPGNYPWLNRYCGAKVRVDHIQSDTIALRVLDGKAAGYLALVPPHEITAEWFTPIPD